MNLPSDSAHAADILHAKGLEVGRGGIVGIKRTPSGEAICRRTATGVEMTLGGKATAHPDVRTAFATLDASAPGARERAVAPPVASAPPPVIPAAPLPSAAVIEGEGDAAVLAELERRAAPDTEPAPVAFDDETSNETKLEAAPVVDASLDDISARLEDLAGGTTRTADDGTDDSITRELARRASL